MRQDLWYDCIHCFFDLYERSVPVFRIIIYSTGFAGTVYSRPIPTKMSRCCTTSFPAVPIHNCGLFLQRNPNHKSDSTTLVKVCGKNLAWKNIPFKDLLLFFFACFSNQFLNTTRKCLEICGVQIPNQHFFTLKTKQKKQTRIHHKPSVPLAWVLQFVKSLIYFKTIILNWLYIYGSRQGKQQKHSEDTLFCKKAKSTR